MKVPQKIHSLGTCLVIFFTLTLSWNRSGLAQAGFDPSRWQPKRDSIKYPIRAPTLSTSLKRTLRRDIQESLRKETLLKPYRDLVERYTRIQEQLIWVNQEHPHGYNWWDDPERRSDLEASLLRLEAGNIPEPQDPPQTIVDPRVPEAQYYTEEDAWRMYVNHVAQSLWFERHGGLWTVTDETLYGPDELALLFNSKEYITWYPGPPTGGKYHFNSTRNGGGRSAVIDWNATVNYLKLGEAGLLRNTQAESIYALTDWMRGHLRHDLSPRGRTWEEYWDLQESRYGYRGDTPIDKIITPPPGVPYYTQGCSGTTSLYAALLHSINIPVKRLGPILRNGPHSSPQFPTVDSLALTHGDDPYYDFFRPGRKQVPTSNMFLTSDEWVSQIENPVREPSRGHTPTLGEQSSYNAMKRHLSQAYDFLADALLAVRAAELINLSGPDIGLNEVFTGDFWKPLFSPEERNQMTITIDNYLRDLGEGDLLAGSQYLLERYRPYQQTLDVRE